MRTRRLILLQVLFFLFFSILAYLFRDLPNIKRTVSLLLVLGLSLCLGKYFYYATQCKKAYLVVLFSLFFLFELKKIVSYYLGLLPMYAENTLISAFISFIIFSLYSGFIFFIARRIKKKRGAS